MLLWLVLISISCPSQSVLILLVNEWSGINTSLVIVDCVDCCVPSLSLFCLVRVSLMLWATEGVLWGNDWRFVLIALLRLRWSRREAREDGTGCFRQNRWCFLAFMLFFTPFLLQWLKNYQEKQLRGGRDSFWLVSLGYSPSLWGSHDRSSNTSHVSSQQREVTVCVLLACLCSVRFPRLTQFRKPCLSNGAT